MNRFDINKDGKVSFDEYVGDRSKINVIHNWVVIYKNELC